MTSSFTDADLVRGVAPGAVAGAVVDVVVVTTLSRLDRPGRPCHYPLANGSHNTARGHAQDLVDYCPRNKI
jgi:hypothetical protein